MPRPRSHGGTGRFLLGRGMATDKALKQNLKRDPSEYRVCPECGKSVLLRKDGTLRGHQTLRYKVSCLGSGVVPAVEDPESGG